MTKPPALQKDEPPIVDSPRVEAHTVRLPWPDKRLSPNARVHWRTRAAATRRARRITRKLCMEAGIAAADALLSGPVTGKTRVPLSLTFYAPDARRRDDDNLIAAFKPYRDELAAVLGIDDSQFKCHYAVCGPALDCPKGAVIVTIGLVFEKECDRLN